MTKEYRININPRILELLGPNLYTNIYYVLAELVANAYDADAKNVFIEAGEHSIRVEDDGEGMSYVDKDIERYLQVAKVSRQNEEDSRTPSGRLKMGRKGIGKLAALSVSEEVNVMTIRKNDKSGFVLSRKPYGENGLLKPLDDRDVQFHYVKDHGTAIEMLNPQYDIHKTDDAIKRNLLKIFPYVDNDFRIHIIRGNHDTIIDKFDRNIAKSLCALITLGDGFKYMCEKVPNVFPQHRDELVIQEDPYVKDLSLTNNDGETKNYVLRIEGWIGTYASTRGRKKDLTDFPDNFISLYANKKLGEFNILPVVGKNRLNESYVVGQLYIDLFELSELPDMALSNRQGYRTDDPRYAEVINFVRNSLLPRIINMRVVYANLDHSGKKKEEIKKLKSKELQLKRDIEKFKEKASDAVYEKISGKISDSKQNADDFQKAIKEALNDTMPELGIKPVVDGKKKKILISQNSEDKEIADLVYGFLLFNGAPAEDIIYSNCDDYKSRIPEDVSIYDYLRDFFVDSYSTTKIYTIFVTSEHTPNHLGSVAEIGAAWITGIGQKIFNVYPYMPQPPLDITKTWQVSYYSEEDKLCMNTQNADSFCVKIEDICQKLGYAVKDHQENKDHLSRLVTITT